MLLCNPHNPIGRAWTELELQTVSSICSRHDVLVISDEIHADLLVPGKLHVSFMSITTGQHLPIICSAASKTFNLSGLHAAYLFVASADVRQRVETQLWAQGAGTPGLMACEALAVAYAKDDEWLEKLNEYVYENYSFLKTFIQEHLGRIKVLPLEATYLVWLDCKHTGLKSQEIADLLVNKEKLWVNPGDMYGASGEGFLRINIACSRDTLLDGSNLLKNVLGPLVNDAASF